MSVPFQMVNVDGEDHEKIANAFKGFKGMPLTKVGHEKIILSPRYQVMAPNIYNFNIRPDDVFIVTYPRSGTTVTQELIWLVANNFDFSAAKSSPLSSRFPYLERLLMLNDIQIQELQEKSRNNPNIAPVMTVKMLMEQTERRFLKTHLHFTLHHPKLLDICKVVYVARHPKNIAVSYFHLCRLMPAAAYDGDFATFWDLFERDLVPFSPYWEHLKQAWDNRDHPNMLFLFYEEVVKNTDATIRKVAKHLGVNATDEQVKQLADHLNFDNFKKNPAVNLEMINVKSIRTDTDEKFIRKGQSGGWESYFTPEMNARADKWIEENLKKLPGFVFPTKV